MPITSDTEDAYLNLNFFPDGLFQEYEIQLLNPTSCSKIPVTVFVIFVWVLCKFIERDYDDLYEVKWWFTAIKVGKK